MNDSPPIPGDRTLPEPDAPGTPRTPAGAEAERASEHGHGAGTDPQAASREYRIRAAIEALSDSASPEAAGKRLQDLGMSVRTHHGDIYLVDVGSSTAVRRLSRDHAGLTGEPIADSAAPPGSEVVVAESSLPAPLLSYDTKTNDWVLREAYPYEHQGVRITVPEGFRFDLASVPREAWPLVAPFELSISAPLLHDYLYRSGGAPAGCHPQRTFTRSETDGLFRDVMRREGVPDWRVQSAYTAVRLFGGKSWRSPGDLPREREPAGPVADDTPERALFEARSPTELRNRLGDLGYGIRHEEGQTYLTDLQSTRNALRVDPAVVDQVLARFRGERAAVPGGPHADEAGMTPRLPGGRPVLTDVPFNPMELLERRDSERVAGRVAELGGDGRGLNPREATAVAATLEAHHVDRVIERLDTHRRTIGDLQGTIAEMKQAETRIAETRPAVAAALRNAYRQPEAARKSLERLMDTEGPRAAQTRVLKDPRILGELNRGTPLDGLRNRLLRGVGQGGYDDSRQREQAGVAVQHARLLHEQVAKQREPWKAPDGQTYSTPVEKITAATIGIRKQSEALQVLQYEVQNRGGIRGARARAEHAVRALSPEERTRVHARLLAHEQRAAGPAPDRKAPGLSAQADRSARGGASLSFMEAVRGAQKVRDTAARSFEGP